jgi:hypothetical protein
MILDGAAARIRALDASAFASTAAITVVLVENAIPNGSGTSRRSRESVSRDDDGIVELPRLLQIEAAHLNTESGGVRGDGVDAGDECRRRV